MVTIYREADADPRVLEGKTIAVIGYGNQGRAQALNLRDTGLRVIVGNIDDPYADKARADGFDVAAIAAAVARAEVIMLLIPDEVMAGVFDAQIRPALKPGSAVSFASGYNVAFGQMRLPDDVDVILLAPRMIGRGVRDLYSSGQGFFSFVAVERDATGTAKAVLLALAAGIGTLKKGAVEVTFRMEAELDLFNEQGFGPAFGKVLLSAIRTLLEAGYPREAVFLEVYLSGELGYICQSITETGLAGQLREHSQTSQYGAISRGIQFLWVNLKKPMKRVLRNIRNGKFANEWNFEQRTGKLRYRLLKELALRQPILRMEEGVRKTLGLREPHQQDQ